MKLQAAAAAGAALAPLVLAVPHQQPQRRHGHLHEKRDIETQIEWAYVTEYVTVTAGGSGQNWDYHWHHQSSSAATSSILAAPSSSSTATVVAPASSATSSSTKSVAVKKPTTTVASASSSAASSPPVKSKISKSNLTPNGRKAGLSGYIGIQNTNAFSELAPYISWYSDYTANTPTYQSVEGIGMLWGADGSTCTDVFTDRLETFNDLIASGTVPDIMFGFYEPDCYCEMSSQMPTSSGTSDWNSLLAPLSQKGTVLGSPSMCKQKDEDWLKPFIAEGLAADWDVTSLHINKPDLQGVIDDVEYYVSTYGKPVWITEFACVFDQDDFTACTDQDQIDGFINDAVKYFEGNSSVVAYGPSNGAGLGTAWPLTNNGELSATGQAYLNAIKNL